MLVATEYRLRQVCATEMFGVVYVVFNVIFFYTGPTDEKVIYDILDWGGDPGKASAFVVVILVVLVPLFGLAHFGVFKCVVPCRYSRQNIPTLWRKHATI